MTPTVIQLIGGDLRQLSLASRLYKHGFTVHISGFSTSLPAAQHYFPYLIDTIEESPGNFRTDASAYLLPLPVSRDDQTVNCSLCDDNSPLELNSLFSRIPCGSLVLGGRLSSFITRLAIEHNIRLIDYYESESVQIRNAVPTAEGAVQIAMQELPITLFSSACVVIGFGRVGRILAMTLRALGAHVTVCARNPADRSWAVSMGCSTMELCEFLSAPSACDVIFNTVPVCLLREETLIKIDGRPLYIELASSMGCDKSAAEKAGIRVIEAASLPGRVAPLTAGDILADAVLEIFRKELQ